ncbi:MAG: primosomal protein N' [Bacteroidetes bacterium]|nr:primosomal protein N' [Bacteroidota bacterium]
MVESGEKENEEVTGTLFAELLLPVPVARHFTYRVPATWNDRIRVGQRCIVPFGQRKILTGIVVNIHSHPPQEYEAKYLLDILDEHEILTPVQFKLFNWMAAYYMCAPGEVLQAALPAGLKLSSESMVQIHPSFSLDESDFSFSDKELMVLKHLENEPASYSDIAKLLGVKSIYSILKSLTSKEAVLIYESVRERYHPKTEKRIRLMPDYLTKSALEKLFEVVSTKPKQETVILKYLQAVPVFQDAKSNDQGVARKALLDEDVSESSLQTLIRNGILEEFEKIVPRFGFADSIAPPLLLSEQQEQARNRILEALDKTGAALLQGVTGSGKTEIYIDLIRRALDGGSQVLYLLPEIALTTQIVLRLQRVFGSTMGVYHSKFSDNERVEVWNGVLNGTFRFVVGVRSAVFLPFDNLGLIIVDEEHDPSYKQHDPAPRYHARDVARMIGQFHSAKVLMGTATPSCETYYQAVTGKIGHILLSERFGEASLPEIVFADLSRERKQKSMKGEFSSRLLKEIKDTLSSNNQVILFQNRRGHSPLVQCQDCGWIPKCINCSVSLTYHQYRHAMVCHYCGYREALPQQCTECSSARILTLGYGTEKLEEEIKLHFPEANTARMDLDTTRNRSSYESIIGDFEQGKTNILVGTQMVTKGLDFGNVSLVGIFDADRMMHYPDFRSYERAFQLMLQVSGRAGRREKKGKVVIQTSQPQHPLFGYVSTQRVTEFLNDQLDDRRTHSYPPFTRLIEITLRHMDRSLCYQAAQQLSAGIQKQVKGTTLLGPTEPMISKIRNEYVQSILLKIPRDQGRLSDIKGILQASAERLAQTKEFRNVRVVFDVDPV